MPGSSIPPEVAKDIIVPDIVEVVIATPEISRMLEAVTENEEPDGILTPWILAVFLAAL